MLTTHGWSNQIFNDCPHVDGCVFIPFNVGKWLFVGCIIFSFLLVCQVFVQITSPCLVDYINPSWLMKRARQKKSLPVGISRMLLRTKWPTTIIPSVSSLHSWKNNSTLSIPCLIGSYDHFCFFDHISNSTKTSDDFAFFVFFVFKS